MKRTVHLKDVAEAVKSLEEREEKVTCRSILAITGGGMSTVLRLKGELDKQNALRLAFPSKDISTFLIESILAEIADQVTKATSHLNTQLATLEKREADLLDEYENVENENRQLTEELLTLRVDLNDSKTEFDKQIAIVSNEKNVLTLRINELETERKQLIDARESARTETATLQLQIERADTLAKRHEDQLQEMLVERNGLTSSLQEAEKQAAVSNQKVEDQKEYISQIQALIGELKTENRALTSNLQDMQQRTAHAEKIAAVAENAREILQDKMESHCSGVSSNSQSSREVAENSEKGGRGRPRKGHVFQK